MVCLTFIDKSTRDSIMNNGEPIVGEHYCSNVDACVIGVIPRVDDIVVQVRMLFSYLVSRDARYCLYFNTAEDSLDKFDIIDVLTYEHNMTKVSTNNYLVVVPQISIENVICDYTARDIVSQHELLKYHLPDILAKLGHYELFKVKIDWYTIESVWTSMEKTGKFDRDDLKRIVTAVSEV